MDMENSAIPVEVGAEGVQLVVLVNGAPPSEAEPLHYVEGEGTVYACDEADKRMLPCQKFLQGICERGTACVYYHPAPEDLATAITSPPFPEDFGAEEAMGSIVQGMVGLNMDGDTGAPPWVNGYGRGRRRGRGGYVPHRQRSPRYGGQRRSAPMRLEPRNQRPFNYRYHQQDRSETSSLDRNGSQIPQRPRANRQFYYDYPPAPDYPSVHDYPPAPTYQEPRQYAQHYSPPLPPQEVYIPPLMPVSSPFEGYEAPYNNEFGPSEQEQEPSPEYDDGSGTMFKHINWSEFLAPGQLPPAFVAVPGYDPPVRKPGRNLLQFMTPPHGRDSQETEVLTPQKMAVKQEFRQKVTLAAAPEPEPEAEEEAEETVPRGGEEVINPAPESNEENQDAAQ